MIGLDTNVLVRYIMQDDAKQSARASALLESLNQDQPGFISLVSIVELYWVLTSCYGLSHQQVGEALNLLLRTRELVVDRADEVLRALRIFAAGKADFADCLIGCSAAAAGCTETLTFDENAAKSAGMALIR